MSSRQSPACSPRKRIRARKQGRGVRKILAVLAALLMLAAPLAAPAQAEIDAGPPPNALPTSGANTDILITSLGEGRRNVTGALPPAGSTWSIDSYPTSIPAGYVAETVGFAGVINTQEIDGTTTAQMYCIDLRTSTRVGIGYENGSWDESNVPNIGYVNRILNGYYPTTDLPASVEPHTKAAAVQAAIWFFTDGYVLRPNSELYPLVSQIVNSTIASGPLAEPDAPDISITPPRPQGRSTVLPAPTRWLPRPMKSPSPWTTVLASSQTPREPFH